MAYKTTRVILLQKNSCLSLEKFLKMKVLFLLAVLTVWQADAQGSTPAPLKCRRCIGANSLDDCTFSVPCPPGEVCYMDEVVTEQLTIEYNGGCRPRDVCSRGAVGKRDGALVACTKCCETKKSPECNTKLCGIKSSVVNSSQCYNCEIGVDDPNTCTSLVSCQSDQVCGAETFKLSTHEKFEFKCLSKQVCTMLTKAALEELAYCRQPDHDPERCNNIGKRDISGQRVCTACCGDALCNSDRCEAVLETLYNQWKLGVLDLNTLKRNASAPLTTTSSSPVGR